MSAWSGLGAGRWAGLRPGALGRARRHSHGRSRPLRSCLRHFHTCSNTPHGPLISTS